MPQIFKVRLLILEGVLQVTDLAGKDVDVFFNLMDFIQQQHTLLAVQPVLNQCTQLAPLCSSRCSSACCFLRICAEVLFTSERAR